MPAILPHLIAQHAAEAADLWMMRRAFLDEPHIRLRDLAEHDDRIEAHLDGLRIAGEGAWPVIRQEFAWDDAGQIFVGSLLAFESDRRALIEEMQNTGAATRDLRRGLIGALSWLPRAFAARHLLPLHASPSPRMRHVALSAALAQRIDPGEALRAALHDPHRPLRARALMGLGELGGGRGLAEARNHLAAADPNCRFAAAWSLALRGGDARAVDVLLELAVAAAPRSGAALSVALRRMDAAAAHRWLGTLAELPATARLAVQGWGILGDPAAVPRLLDAMRLPALARVAGEAFTMITGADLQERYLDTDAPPASDADEEPPPDPDENLRWPDPDKAAAWWSAHHAEFRAGARHLLGKPMAVEWLRQALKMGRQRQRMAAALELAVRELHAPLVNTRAPGGGAR